LLFVALLAASAQTVVPTGQMVERPEGSPTATLLMDGRVMVAGGSRFSSVQIYDPAKGTWRLVGTTVVPQEYSWAVLLRDGRVLISGDSTLLEIFDPKTEKFSSVGNTPDPPRSMLLLEDGRVLVSHRGLSVSFDLTSGTISDSLGPIEEGRLIALPYSRFVVIGVSSALIYEVQASALRPLERHDFGRTIFDRSAVLLRDGNILIAGGEGTSEALLYNSRGGTVRRTGVLPEPQTLFRMAALNGGTHSPGQS
jgi:hypothetical protein